LYHSGKSLDNEEKTQNKSFSSCYGKTRLLMEESTGFPCVLFNRINYQFDKNILSFSADKGKRKKEVFLLEW